jgi:hypothetical protein
LESSYLNFGSISEALIGSLAAGSAIYLTSLFSRWILRKLKRIKVQKALIHYIKFRY